MLIGVVYMALIVWSVSGYAKVKRKRRAAATGDGPADEASATPPGARKPLAVDEVDAALSEKRDR